MSLENQVAALVSAASKLTSEIAGKMKGIDQKVDKATQAVPESIKSAAYTRIYVNSINGNDKNDGSSAALAKKTIGAAIASVPEGFAARVDLSPGEYDLDSDAQISGKVISIVGRSVSKEDYIIRSIPYQESNSSNNVHTWSGGFRMGLRGVLTMVGVTLKTAYVDVNGPIMLAYTGSMINTSSANGIVLLQHTNIHIYHGAFMHQHDSGSFGSCDLRMRECQVIKEDTSSSLYDGRPYLIDQIGTEAFPYELYGTSIELKGFSSWAAAVRVRHANITSNLI